MIRRKYWEVFYKAVLLTLTFLLFSNPVLVAAMPQNVDPRQEALDTLYASGDLYLSKTGEATSLAVELMKSVSAIQSTPLTQINENAVSQARTNALRSAEDSAIVIGAIDDLATSVASLAGDNLAPAFDPFQQAAEGLPLELREDLIQEGGLTSAEVDAISSGMDDSLLKRREMATNGMPADIAQRLLQSGFSQAEIDQLASVAGTRGLANTSLPTSLAQFRATQDEWADVRTQLLILNIQLIGYQIGVRQANGIEPRAVTEAELQEITDDELRLLVHVAHLQELWGTDPDLEKGEGDWWFIEHYAERAAERLDALVIDSQNRGLVPDLFVLQKIKLLALGAKHGDANYAKTELDGIGELLSSLVGDETFIAQQRDELRGFRYVAARLVSHPQVRERLQWPLDQEVQTSAIKNAQVRLDTMGVRDLAPLYGVIAEQNENNNIRTFIFVAGDPYWDLFWGMLADYIDSHGGWWNFFGEALYGKGDVGVLLANMTLSLLPLVRTVSAIAGLFTAESPFEFALMFFALVFGLVKDIVYVATILFPEALAWSIPPFIWTMGGNAIITVLANLYETRPAFRLVLNGFRFRTSIIMIGDFMEYVLPKLVAYADDISGLEDVIELVWGMLGVGTRAVFPYFCAFVQHVGEEGVLLYGINDSSMLVGRILYMGVDLNSGAVNTVYKIGNTLHEWGFDLSDDTAYGLGRAANTFGGFELELIIQKILNENAELLGNVLKSFKKLDEEGKLDMAKILARKIGMDNFGLLLLKFANDPNNLADMSRMLEVFGDLQVHPDVVKKAATYGPDAINTLSYWPKDLLKNTATGMELAARAGKDTETLQEVQVWVSGGTPNITKIARNSVFGNGNIFVIGKEPEGSATWYDAGFIKYARDRNYMYYSLHPQVSVRLGSAFGGLLNDALWSIHKKALENPISSGKRFHYSLHAFNGNTTSIQNDINAIHAIEQTVEFGGSWESAVSPFFPSGIPSRMYAVHELLEQDYVFSEEGYETTQVFNFTR